MTNTPQKKIVYALYSEANDTYLCWDSFDKYYYWGQKEDDNVLCWDSPTALNKIYLVAVKSFSVMKIPSVNPRCALLYKNT